MCVMSLIPRPFARERDKKVKTMDSKTKTTSNDGCWICDKDLDQKKSSNKRTQTTQKTNLYGGEKTESKSTN